MSIRRCSLARPSLPPWRQKRIAHRLPKAANGPRGGHYVVYRPWHTPPPTASLRSTKCPAEPGDLYRISPPRFHSGLTSPPKRDKSRKLGERGGGGVQRSVGEGGQFLVGQKVRPFRERDLRCSRAPSQAHAGHRLRNGGLEALSGWNVAGV